jgi:hypothetical protein
MCSCCAQGESVIRAQQGPQARDLLWRRKWGAFDSSPDVLGQRECLRLALFFGQTERRLLFEPNAGGKVGRLMRGRHGDSEICPWG